MAIIVCSNHKQVMNRDVSATASIGCLAIHEPVAHILLCKHSFFPQPSNKAADAAPVVETAAGRRKMTDCLWIDKQLDEIKSVGRGPAVTDEKQITICKDGHFQIGKKIWMV